jgi:hypothetical protein
MLEQMMLGDHEDSRKLPEKKEPQCIVFSPKERGQTARTV